MSASLSALAAFKRHQRQALLAFSVVLGSCLLTGLLTPPEYRSELKMIFENDTKNPTGIQGFNDGGAYTQASDPLENKLELLKTSAVLRTAIERGDLRNPKTGEPLREDQLRGGLDAKTILGTDIVALTFKSDDPQLARQSIDAIANAIIDDTVTSARARAHALRLFIEKKLPEVERNLKLAEKHLQEFQRSSGSVEIAAEAQNAVKEVADLETQQRTLSQGIASAGSQIADIRRQLGGKDTQSAVTAVRISEDPSVQALRTKLAELNAEIAKQEARLGPKHPQMVALLDQRAELQKTINEQIRQLGGQASQSRGRVDPVSQNLTNKLAELEVLRSGNQQELSTVQGSINRYRQRLAALPQRQVTYAQLQRAVTVNTTAFNLLANRLEEAKITEAQSFTNVRIVDPASLPVNPSWPNFFLLGAGGVLVGLGAAAGVVALGEATRRKDLSHQEVQEMLQVPVLASLPQLEAGASDMLKTWNREAYRMLCMNLRFLGHAPVGQAAVIVVGSAMANEGKSTVATRLATSLAQAGQRTLIIDADLVRPSLTDAFNLEPGVGLAEWLYSAAVMIPSGKAIPHVKEYVRETPTRNLSVLSAGELRLADSASLLDAITVETLLGQLEAHYDQIIIDTPPLAGYAHGYAFGAKARGILLVLSPHRTDQEVVQRVRQSLERSNIHLLGTVINGVAPEEGRTFSYYDRSPKPRILLELAE